MSEPQAGAITEPDTGPITKPETGPTEPQAGAITEPQAATPGPQQGRRRRFALRPGRRASYREGASFNAVTFVLSTLLSVISSIACSRLYGIIAIGEYALAVGAVSAVRLLSTAKERPALVRELTKSEPRHPRVTGLFAGTLTFSAVLTLVVGAAAVGICHLLLSGPISQPSLFWPLAANVGGYVIFGNSCENIEVVASAFRAGRQLLWCRLGDAISFIIIAVALYSTNSVWGLVLASCGSQAIGLVQRLIRIRPFMRFTASRATLADGFRTVPGLIRFGLKIAPGALADGASNESGTWLVALYDPIAVVGAFGRAYLIIKQVMVVNMYTTEMLFPTLVERLQAKDFSGYARVLVDSLRYTGICLMVCAAIGAGVAPGVMHVFGPHFAQGGNTLAILLPVPGLMIMSQIMRFSLYSLDRAWMASLSGGIRLVVTITAGTLATWKFGAVGAASAIVGGFIVDISFVTSIVVRHLATPMRTLWRPREWMSLAAACVGAFVAGRIVFDAIGYPVGLFAGGLAATVVSIAILLATRAVNERDLTRIREVRSALARRRAARSAAPIVDPS